MSDYAEHYQTVIGMGYSIIPIKPGEKRPAISKWQTYCKRQPTDSEATQWLEYGGGIGLPCGTYCVAVDIDLLDPTRAAEAERRVLEITGCDEVPVRTGRYPKRVLLYRPEGSIASQSFRWEEKEFVAADGKAVPQGFEILSSGKQVVAFGVHPDTNRAYVWRGGSPVTVARDALPVITPTMVDAIKSALNALRPLDQPSPPAPPKSLDRAPASKSDGINAEAVNYIVERLPNTEGTTWDQWVRIGFAIHKCMGSQGWSAFNYWSSKSSRYDERETVKKWQTIIRDDRGEVGFGTLLAEATAHGIKLPAEIRFSANEPAPPEIDISHYVDRLAQIEVGPDGMSSADYWIYLNYVYSGTEDVGALYRERCENEPEPQSVSAGDVERVRMTVLKQLGSVGGESPRRVQVAYRSVVTLEHMKEFFLKNIEAQEVHETDNAVTEHGMTIRLSPRDMPTPPAAARFRVPGVICEFAEWVDETSPAQVPEFGVTAGLALVSVLCGRAVKTLTGIRPNIYVLNLATSGAGKNNSIKRLRRALASAGALDRHTFGSNATSGAAIRNRFADAAGKKDEADSADGSSMSKIWLSDEMGGVWSQATQNAALGASIMADLLTFFSASDEIMEGTAMAQKAASSLPYPHLSILGTSTPSALFEKMTMEHLRAGHANRFLMMEPRDLKPRSYAEKVSKWSGNKGHTKVPSGVVNTVAALVAWCDQQRGLIASPWEDWAYTMPMEPDAIQLIAKIEELKERAVREAERDGIVSEPFSRLDEMTCKIAMLSAMSRLTETLGKNGNTYHVIGNPVIMETDVRFGFELARYSAERVAHAASNVAGDADAAQVAQVLQIVRKAGSEGVKRAVLMRKGRMSKRALDSAVETLTDSRQIIGVKSNSKTRPGMTYYLTAGAKRAIRDGTLDPAVETTW